MIIIYDDITTVNMVCVIMDIFRRIMTITTNSRANIITVKNIKLINFNCNNSVNFQTSLRYYSEDHFFQAKEDLNHKKVLSMNLLIYRCLFTSSSEYFDIHLLFMGVYIIAGMV